MKKLAALVALYAALVVPAMFARDLWDPDEPRFAQIGREMLRSGDWVVPHFNGEPIALLPPLHDWVSVVAGLPAGDVTPAAARTGAALGGLIALLALWLLAKRWWGDGVATWAGFVLMTSAVFWLQASYAQVDMLLAGLVTAAMVAFRVAWEEDDRGLKWFLGGCALTALGTLTKGPVAAVLPGLVFLALAIIERRRGFIRLPWMLAGLGVYLALAVPWYIAACRRGGPAFTHELLFTHNFGMFFEDWSHHQPPWYYLLNLPWMLAPWIVFLPAAALGSRDAMGGWKTVWKGEKRDPEPDRHRFLWIWLGALFLFFSIAQAKQAKYLLPAVPAAALLIGRELDRLARGQGRGLVPAVGVLALVGVLAMFSPQLLKHWPEAEPFSGTALILASVAAASWIPAFLMSRRSPAAALAATVTGAMLLCLAAADIAFPAVDKLKSARPLCERIRKQMGPGDQAGIYGIQKLKTGAFRYYLDRPLAAFEDANEHAEPAALEKWWNANAARWLVLDRADAAALPAALRDSFDVVESGQVGHRTIDVVRRRRGVKVGSLLEGELRADGTMRLGGVEATIAQVEEALQDGMFLRIRAEPAAPAGTFLQVISRLLRRRIRWLELEVGGRAAPIEINPPEVSIYFPEEGEVAPRPAHPTERVGQADIPFEYLVVVLCSGDPPAHIADREQHQSFRAPTQPKEGVLTWLDGDAAGARPFDAAAVLRAVSLRQKALLQEVGRVHLEIDVDPAVPCSVLLDLLATLKEAGLDPPLLLEN